MNLSITKEKFSHLLYLANSIVERRNTMPILANVKLDAEGERLAITATDLEVSLIGEAECSVKSPGTITVEARMLHDIVRELPNELVTVTLTKGQRLEIACGQSKFKINGLSADEFPSVTGTTLSKPTEVDAAMFYEMFDKTFFAVSTDETRYNINGVLVETVRDPETKKQMIRFVATDGHRLAMIDRVADGLNLVESVIIPRKGIQEIKKVLEGNDETAQVEVRDGFFTVRSGRVTLGVRLVDGQFPDYRQVIPAESKTLVDAERLALLSAVKRVSLVTTDKTRAVRFRVEDGAITVLSSSPEYGEASESIPAMRTGEDLSIGFSARYLMDLLNGMGESTTVSVKLNGELGPGVFTTKDCENYTCIVMPMRFE